MNGRALLYLLLAPLPAFFVPWLLPAVFGHRRVAVMLLVAWLLAGGVAVLAAFGVGLLLLAICGLAGLLAAARPLREA